MKRIIALICCAALAGALAGCGGGAGNGTQAPSPRGGLKPSEYQDSDFDTSGDIIIKTEYEVYGSDVPEISYTIANNTAAELTYGVEYAVEVSKDGTWYQVPFPENMAWIMIGVILKPHAVNSGSFKLSDLDYRFADGSYRLIKKIGDKRYFAEFRIGPSAITAETPFGYQPLEKLPEDYSSEAAAANGDVVFSLKGTWNTEKLAAFVDKAALGMPAMLRLVRFTIEGDPIILDCVYNENHSGYYLFKHDNSRDKFGADPGITQTIYSYLITDGAGLYLSNCAGWEMTKIYIGAATARIPWPSDAADISGPVQAVERMTEKRLGGNLARYKVYSPGGGKSVSLSEEKLSYGYERPGRGEIQSLANPDGSVTQIRDIVWLDDASFVLICDTSSNLKYFSAVGAAGKSGFGTDYKITNGVFEIVK
ncbi:protein of unknown function [Sporobacter termitidis DSM 10068]|uniref:Bacterial Ig-like domain-containing protein n=1 Tax=Sporobacter termitidis DSM 10068 TaxID=1123282 RepID=A0A1M5YFL7_9FIRM|nr:immunoglobulin-like domain-containing protein [Sporobacter termitidis]SHI10861.1 protein of unknown function [Sporobacter termitidis DSM 10068]